MNKHGMIYKNQLLLSKERRKFMPKINSYEQRFHQIVNNILDIIVEFDLKGNFTYVSPQVYDILGYYPDELIGVNGSKFVHPEDLPKAMDLMRDFSNSKEQNSVKRFSIEYRVLHKKGYYIFLSIKGSLVETEGNMKIIAVVSDITEQLKSKQKLKESEEKFRTIIENAKEGYYEVDLKGNFTFYNSALSNLLKYSPNELMGMNFDKIMNEENKKLTYRAFNYAYRTGVERPEFQYELINKNGENLYGETSIYVRYDSDGSKIGFSGFIRDITEKKEAEQRLKESEEKFRTMAEQSVVGFIIIQDNQVIYLNNTVAHIFGFLLEELNNMRLVDLFNFIHPEDRSILMSQFQKREEMISSENSAEISSKPFRGITKSGEIRWINVYTRMFKFQEKYTTFATIVDVTKERMAEKELQKLNELKSEFLRRASHELKTPLISIKGFTNLILTQYAGTLDTEIISMLEEVDRGCHRLEDIIKNLIEATKIESSKLDLKTTVEDLSFLIRFCLNELRGLAKSRNHAIHVKIDKKIITKFNKEQMYEVITNLLSNAIKYTPPTGEITIKSEIKDQNVIISIKDNGIGFTDKEKEIVFKQFGKIERYGQGLDISIDGSGLGLYLSKKIVELHGGNIWMESEGKNQGSIFYISLPLIKN